MKTSIRLAIAQAVCRPLPPILSQKVRSLIYPYSMAIADNREVTIQSQTGSLFKGRTADFHAYPFSVHGYSEWRNTAIAVALAKAGDTIVEIGANVGTETVGFSDIVGPTGLVYAFEPLPSNVTALEEVSRLARFKNIRIRPCALSDRTGTVSFVVPRAHESGMGHVLPSQEAAAARSDTVSVDCATLDAYTDAVGKSSIIFMDTEGEELKVLRGARAFLERMAPVIVLEASPHHLGRAGSTLADLRATVEELGYTPYVIGRLSVGPVAVTNETHCHNWICIPRNDQGLLKRVRRSLLRCAFMPVLGHLNPLRVS